MKANKGSAGVDGLGLLQRIREMGPHPQTIMITGYPMIPEEAGWLFGLAPLHADREIANLVRG